MVARGDTSCSPNWSWKVDYVFFYYVQYVSYTYVILCDIMKSTNMIIWYYLILYDIIWYYLILYDRRKFRSETSDNMDSWKAEVRRVRRDKIRRKKMQMREKVGKSRNTVFFQWFVAQEGRKVGSLKRRVRSQLVTGAMKNCTPLWREAHFQVKRYKTPQRRTTFGSWDVEKVHAVVARSTFPSQNVQNTRVRTTFGSWDVEKVHAVVARSTFPSQNVQNTSASDHFLKFRCRKSARRCARSTFRSQKC